MKECIVCRKSGCFAHRTAVYGSFIQDKKLTADINEYNERQVLIEERKIEVLLVIYLIIKVDIK